MYTSGEYRQRLSASDKPTPDRGTQPLNVFKGKQREHTVSFADSYLPYANSQAPATPNTSPEPSYRPDSTLSVGVDIPLHLTNQPPSPQTALYGSKYNPQRRPSHYGSLPPVPQSPPPKKYDSTFGFAPSAKEQNMRPRISAPMHPVVSDIDMQVDRDVQQVLPVFDFTMKFRVSLQKREMPQ